MTSKICSHCKEKNNPSFQRCWKCNTPFSKTPFSSTSQKKTCDETPLTENQREDFKKYFSALSSEEIVEKMSEGPESYKGEVWAIITAEAKKRELLRDIIETVNPKDSTKKGASKASFSKTPLRQKPRWNSEDFESYPLCEVKKYNANAFGVLGLFADVSLSDLVTRVNETKIFSRMGRDPQIVGGIDILGPFQRNEASIRTAQYLLENPRKRIVEEIFWFWQDGASNRSALERLTANSANDALALWDVAIKEPRTGEYPLIARHNSIVLRHALLLKDEESSKVYGDSHWEEWIRILKDWMALGAEPEFWGLIKKRLKLIHIESPDVMADSIKTSFLFEVLRTNEEILRHHLSVNNFYLVGRHAGVLHACAVPHFYLKKNLDALLADSGKEVRDAVTKARKEYQDETENIEGREKVIAACQDVRKQLIRKIEMALIRIETLDINSISDAALAAEEYGNFLRMLAFKLSQEAEAHQEAKFIIGEALRYSTTPILRKRLEEDWDALSRLTVADDLLKGEKNSLVDEVFKEEKKKDHARDSQNSKGSDSDHSKAVPPNYGLSYGVLVKGNQIFVPPVCNCCLSSTDRKETVSYQYQSGNTKHTVSFNLPICKECLKHRANLGYKLFGCISISIAFSIGWLSALLRLWPFATVEFSITSAAIAGAAGYFIANKMLPYAGVTEKHGGSETSAKLTLAYGGINTFEFSSLAYAVLFANANSSIVQKAKKLKHSRKKIFPIKSKSFLFVFLWSAGIFLVSAWIMWSSGLHATLYIDNTYGSSISLNLGGQKIVRVPIGVSPIEVPVGNYTVTGASELTPLFSTSISIAGGGKWLFNPERRNSYMIKEIKYGNAYRAPHDSDLGNPELFRINTDYIFERPPKSISTKSSGAIRSVLLHNNSNELETRMEALSAEIKSIEAQIEAFKRLKDNMESLANPDRNEYETLIQNANDKIHLHNQKIEEFNALKEQYQRDASKL